MEYLSRGLKEMNLGRLGKVLAVLFSVLCIGGSLGGGTSFQVKQSLSAIEATVPFLAAPSIIPGFETNAWIYGLLMAIAAGVVIIGGIKRIARTAEAIVPSMCGIYLIACLYIILSHFSEIPAAFWLIISSAFTSEAGMGGVIGVLITGFQRAAFSNEAGVGSAAIAHSAARTPYASREGIVALLEPFIDTVVICTMTALVIVISGAYNNPEYADIIASRQGAALTSKAFGEHLFWFPYVLSLAVMLFAFSTIISWSYYGERCWAYLFTEKYSIIYKVVVLLAIFVGSFTTATNVLDFSDLMILAMAVPNILGVIILSNKVKVDLNKYMNKLKAGDFKA